MVVDTYDALFLGGGKGGKSLAMFLAKRGDKVAVIERGFIGGSCINVACIPSKTLIRSAQIAEIMRRATEFGISAAKPVPSMPAVRDRKRGVVSAMIEMNRKAFEASGMEFLLGQGKFVEPRVIEAVLQDGQVRRLTATRIYLNTGSMAAMPTIPGLAEAKPLTNIEALDIDHLPEHLIVIGGGYIGLEMGQAFRRLGSKVTIVQRGPQLAPKEDPEIAAAITQHLRDEGIVVLTGAKTSAVRGVSGEQVELALEVEGQSQTLSGSHLLVATGRTPCTRDLGLEIAGVEVDAHACIKVNDKLQTTAPDIWAIGDCAGTPQFTHASYDDYRVLKTNLTGGSRSTAGRLIPYTVFIDPELGRVGLTETEARAQGFTIKVASMPTAAIPRARTLGETKGLLKVVVDAPSNKILGFAMLGPDAGEVAGAVQTAMLVGADYTVVRDAVYAHPTLVESLNLLFEKIPD